PGPRSADMHCTGREPWTPSRWASSETGAPDRRARAGCAVAGCGRWAWRSCFSPPRLAPSPRQSHRPSSRPGNPEPPPGAAGRRAAPRPPGDAPRPAQPPEAPPPVHVAPPPEAPDHPELTAVGIRWTFFGELVVNTNYNTATMVVGSIPGFVQIRSASTTGQFNVSPGNTFLGVRALPPRLGPVELEAKFDMDFRSNAPYLNENAFLPLVRDLYLQASWSRLRLLAGQASDIISPRSSASLNFYPLSFIPGDIGDYRPP